jgi:CBS domain containing-hemolysin-like protein
MDADLLHLVPIVTFTLISAFCSSSETAFFSLPNSYVKACESSSNYRLRLIAKLMKSPKEILVTIFILNTVVNILVQNSVSAYVGEEGSLLVKILIPFFLLLFFGEIFPKQLGLVKNRFLSEWMSPILDKINRWMGPLREGVLKITIPLSKILFSWLKKDRLLGQEEIEHVLSSSQERGVIYPEEVELASGYLELKQCQARDLMYPKEDMVGYDIQDPLTKLSHLFVEKKEKEVPIYHRTWDTLMGTLSFQIYLLIRDRLKTGRDLQRHLQNPLFVPELAPVRPLLDELLRKGKSLAFAVDEFGGLAGMIQREDILEVVLGTVGNSTKKEKDYQFLSKDSIIADGTMDLEELEELFHVKLRDDATSQSVGGWVIEVIGDIPKGGTLFQRGGLEFQVVSAEPHRVKKLLIRKRNGGGAK